MRRTSGRDLSRGESPSASHRTTGCRQPGRPVARRTMPGEPGRSSSRRWTQLASRWFHAIARRNPASGPHEGWRRCFPPPMKGESRRCWSPPMSSDGDSYDGQRRALEIHDMPAPGDEELLNLATVVACQNGAEVYTYPQEQIPERECRRRHPPVLTRSSKATVRRVARVIGLFPLHAGDHRLLASQAVDLVVA
jgi:hypothetical protein